MPELIAECNGISEMHEIYKVGMCLLSLEYICAPGKLFLNTLNVLLKWFLAIRVLFDLLNTVILDVES